MVKFLRRVGGVLALALHLMASAADDASQTVKDVTLARGHGTTVVKGRIQGQHFIDYRLRVRAGQTIRASLQSSNAGGYFNVLPPGSDGSAMHVGQVAGNRFERRAPDDGVYLLRVYLVRAAARRNESGSYSLSVAVTGRPLLPIPASKDALVPGTRYHAQATVRCSPAYSSATQCEALVTRRAFDGTATVELRWEKKNRRRILFVRGVPVEADVQQPFTFARDERGYGIQFETGEHFEIPEALVFGG